MIVPIVSLFAERVRAQDLCNGYSAYCGRRYSELSYTGAHDSAFVRTSAFNSLFGNQYYKVTTQLDSGIRMLQAQVHAAPNSSGSGSGIELCHTSCDYPGSDFGAVETYMSDISQWMTQNPREVITILWVNNGFDPSVWASAYQSTGLDAFVYTPPSSTGGVLAISDWPTLSELITNGTRLISFLDSGADFETVPWLLDEFSNVWETGYDVSSTAGFACALDRPSDTQSQSSIPASQKMYLINHFLDYELSTSILIPNATYASITNSYSDLTGSLSSQVQNCTLTHGRQPNFLLVDFFDQGVGASLANSAIANNVTYQVSDLFPGAYPVPGSSDYVSEVPGVDLGPINTGAKSSVASVLGGMVSSFMSSATRGSRTSAASTMSVPAATAGSAFVTLGFWCGWAALGSMMTWILF